MEKLIPSPVTSIEEQATGQVPVSHVASVSTSLTVEQENIPHEFVQKS